MFEFLKSKTDKEKDNAIIEVLKAAAQFLTACAFEKRFFAAFMNLDEPTNEELQVEEREYNESVINLEQNCNVKVIKKSPKELLDEYTE